MGDIMIKSAIDHLQKINGWVSKFSLALALRTEISKNTELFDMLKEHHKILYRDGKYKFICTFQALTKNEILACLIKKPYGILRKEICENYSHANKDLIELVEEGNACVIKEIGR